MWAMWIVAIGAFVGYWLESATPLIIALAALVVGVVIAIFAD